MKTLFNRLRLIGKYYPAFILIILSILLLKFYPKINETTQKPSCKIDPMLTFSVVEEKIVDGDLKGKTICDIIELLGQPAHYIKMGSAVSEENIRHLLIYKPHKDDATALYIWIRGKYYHKSKRDEFSGFHFYEMVNYDFWK